MKKKLIMFGSILLLAGCFIFSSYLKNMSFTLLNHVSAQKAEEIKATREEKSGNVLTYINEQVVLFASGEKDPRDDAAWNEFLKTLDDIGRGELMEICQKAYDRKQ